MGNQVNFYSLKQWCMDNSSDFLDVWDYCLNNVYPNEIGHMSTQKVWLKCPREIHESTNVVLQSVIKSIQKGKEYKYCKQCNSIGQSIIDNYSNEYLTKIWSDENILSPFEVSKRGEKKIWLKCLSDPTHPDYDLTVCNFSNSHNCPYCSGKRVCYTNSVGYKMPESINI